MTNSHSNSITNDEFWRNYTIEKHNEFKYSRIDFIVFIIVSAFISLLFNSFFARRFNSWKLDYFLINTKYLWLAYTPLATYATIGLLKNNYYKNIYLERRTQSRDYKVIFQITTRGFNKESILKSVKSVLYWATKYLKDFEIWIVTEDDVDKDFFENLRNINGEYCDLIKIIYVPREYRTKNNTKYKARALNYALEVRRKLGFISDKIWIYLMDEESIVGEDTIVGIIDFIENSSNDGKLVGQGIIVYSNYWGVNKIISVEDFLRTGDDISKSGFHIFSGRVLWGTHGSHLLYRSDLEDRIGWDYGEIRAEDMVFGLLVVKHYGDVLGWLKGKLYEQSPFSIRDFLKQRRRWLWGILDIILKNNCIGLLDKLILVLNLVVWLTSLPSIIIAYVNFIKPTPAPNILFTPIFGFEMCILLYLYYLGAKLNLSIINRNSKIHIIMYLTLIPIAGSLEAIAAWYGLLTYFKSGKSGFEIIRKELVKTNNIKN
ncbi:MAG: glycosyltransferase family 2 protein [Desulfurococcaceae archaeon]